MGEVSTSAYDGFFGIFGVFGIGGVLLRSFRRGELADTN